MAERADVQRANVLGVGVSAIHLAEAVDLILAGVRENRHGYITVTGVHGVMEAQRDPGFRQIFNQAWLVTPDGMPMSWVGHLQGHREMDRVYGPDLIRDIFAATRDGKVRHFFYGGAPGVAEALRAALCEKFPGTVVCGTFTPPFRPLNASEEKELEKMVEDSQPHIMWVGLSTPKQERFMADYIDRIPVNFMIGVGAAFDMHSGRTKQAPLWMQRNGLEWLFRMLQEPRRLARRYLVNNPIFLWKIFRQFMGLKRCSLDS